MTANIRIFVFGLGYSARAFVDGIRDRAASISGTTRSAEKAAAFETRGVRAFIFDGRVAGEGIAEAVRDATHLLVSIAPGESDPVLAHFAEAIGAAPNLKWIGYLSTVGVYGNYGGAWVSESTTPHPTRGRSTERLAAEKAWAKLGSERGVPLATFRIAGIYGPGRNAFVNLAEGKAHRVVKAGQVFNRIHVDDIAAALVAAVDRSAAGIFNLADDEPAPPQDVVAFAAGLMGVPPPPEVPFAEAKLSPMARTFYADNKRVANKRLRQDLGVTLHFPTYRQGLSALWREGAWRSRV
jgi:nucleoside-diphosphate-sugar epimerase